MLVPVKGEAKKREFVTYDFEWIPGTLELRIAGIYDGVNYCSYRTMKDFVDNEITRDSRHKWFFAHSGGRADLLFILEELSKHSCYEVEARMSGSSAVIGIVTRHTGSERCLKVYDPDHSSCNKWTFIDSYWLFRTSLKKIGEKLGMFKSGPDIDEIDDDEKIREWYRSVPLPELRDYNEQDCRVLWHGISQFQEVLLSIGGELQKTIASCAMRLFRRVYLKETINTVDEVNQVSQLSYCASRVEVIQHYASDGFSFDINSSFPHAMTFIAPGAAKRRFRKKIPDNHELFIAEATVEVKDCFLPPLPFRRKQRVFFPTGKWTSWFTGVDLRLLEETGGLIHKIGECIEFEPCDYLRQYAIDIYERRKVAPTEFEKIVYKYLLNSLYGKFGEDEEKCTLIMNPNVEKLNDLRHPSQRKLDELRFSGLPEPEMLFPGAWMEYHASDVPHAHVPFSTHITSIARRTIFHYMKEAIDKNGEVHYCDTDSLSTNKDLWISDDGLGKLKFESKFKSAEYIAPKVYRRDDVVKAKGFSLGKTKETQLKRFKELGEKKELEIERMARLKEMLRNKTWKPYEITVIKRLQGKAIPKRKKLEDGNHTRPWSVDELERSVSQM
jgi:hypothetical protein